jgi:hypothetical protein
MTRLAESQYEKARQFLLKHGRKLEATLFAYEFEQGDPSEVYRQLATFQNTDGGFGHGLEPDLRCKASSALATTTALQILTGMNERDTEMIERAMQYFASSYEEKRNGWDIIPKEAEEAPRAIWWNYGAFNNHWGNPNAEIVGYLNQFPSSQSPELISQLNTYAVNHLNKSCDLKEMHEMQCYLRWADTLSEEPFNQVSGKLDEFVDNCIIRNVEEREGYSGYPLLIVKSPESRYYSKYEDILPGDLDRLIDSQGEDGSWVPNWAWGRFDDVWETSKVEWQGILTLNALRTLRDFGRLGWQ